MGVPMELIRNIFRGGDGNTLQEKHGRIMGRKSEITEEYPAVSLSVRSCTLPSLTALWPNIKKNAPNQTR